MSKKIIWAIIVILIIATGAWFYYRTQTNSDSVFPFNKELLPQPPQFPQ